jgi:hypothetical protein
VFCAAGVPNVHRIPAPIAVSSVALPIRFPDIPPDLDKIPWINLRVGFGRYGDINRSFPSRPHRFSDIIRDVYAGNQPLVFVSMLNPHEPGKNLTALIDGFLEFHNEHPDSLLLLKLAIDNTGDPLERVLTGILRLHISGYELIDSNAVWLATAQLAEPVLADLYRFSCAYLCSSPAEGQNPLLQEAMAYGVVPITTRHTAMLDYFREDNAVIISSQPNPIDRPDTAMGPEPDAIWHLCTSADVACALRQFAGFCKAARRERGARAPRHDRARFLGPHGCSADPQPPPPAAMTHTVFLEVGPSQEIRHSGIPNVTLNVCRYWLQQPGEASRLFLGAVPDRPQRRRSRGGSAQRRAVSADARPPAGEPWSRR